MHLISIYYELTNHLGNVLATVSDRKIPVDKDNDAIIDNYVADITSVKDYGPFGEYLQGRTWRVNEYPKSFNNNASSGFKIKLHKAGTTFLT